MQEQRFFNAAVTVMYRKLVSALAAGTIAMGLLLGTNTASAATVIFGNGGTNATGILGLDVGGTLYDVTFNLQSVAVEVYGIFPGTFFPFTNQTDAGDARTAVADELDTAGATTIGVVGGGATSDVFNIGYDSFILGTGDGIQSVNVARAINETGSTWDFADFNQFTYNFDERAWAEFTTVVPVPAAVWLFGSGLLGLIGMARRKKAA